MVTVIILSAGVYFLYSLVSNGIGIVFALDCIFGKSLLSKDVHPLIAAFLSDLYMVESFSSQHLCAFVFKFMSVHL